MEDVDMNTVTGEALKKHQLQEDFDAAEEEMEEGRATPDRSIAAFQRVLAYHGPDEDLEAVHRVKEHAIYKLGQLYTRHGREKELATLLQSVRPFFTTIPKAKTGKIVRTIIDMVSKVETLDHQKSLQFQADLCVDSIAWCNLEKHTFLRQRIQARLASILFEQAKYQTALDLITDLLREIKKLDDKQLLVEIHLVESKLFHALRNVPKAKAALTAARSIANSIYIVPKMQANIDHMSGILHAEERDYKTAYSYFFEAFEALAPIDKTEALACLKYMLLSKIANGHSADVPVIVNGKNAIKFSGIDVEALKAIAKAHDKRSLELFQAATSQYAAQLVQDPLIKHHLGLLYENLLESNLIKIIQPYSCVEISHVATLIKLPLPQVETKLSQMILDHKFHGILDQGRGQLIVYESATEDKTYAAGLGVIQNVGNVVGTLFRRADKLSM
ncbi:26S proteasome regulatory subunit N6 [Saprolegnia diclina VS20]|uniref:26S proteasome regulatory subunit N6 n=1 Tax=Saprolegnia diclina (strain VS20) TaxID=1156394 RepID=T0QS31_SAPDV|nr:26S proteasome regulatory subunit N6 [Saprolegnia diclina VS20]EQC36815.1 26S proteasome regulatory subunit N6 [Saprolegnia diclina VS20]|eukprot:XP_008609596.1 26S proteasome regulatory subunit N6 [Saprolegnia diclina VS20]